MARGCKLNRLHSVRDWDMVMTKKIITPPDPKTYTVEVEGGDGIIDRSTVLTGGDIKYKNRTITINFEKLDQSGVLLPFLSAFLNEYQGQIVKVVFDEDPAFYYTGRSMISYDQPNGYVLQMTMTIDAEPYKYKHVETIQVKTISGANVPVSYSNLRKWVSPIFITSAPMTLQFENEIYQIDEAGTFTIPDIQFKKGENVILYSGTGTVQVVYQEGDL